MSKEIEKRFNTLSESSVQIRSEDGKNILSGLASVFYRDGDAQTEYKLWGDTVERIDKRAFDNAISRQDDVRALFNHDSNQVLGRTKSGTLKLWLDEVGLRYSVELPDTQLAKDLQESIKRGDITGSSFGFIAQGVEWRDEGDKEVRVITDLALVDVSPVTYPAYEATEVVSRSKEFIQRKQNDIFYINAVIKTLNKRK